MVRSGTDGTVRESKSSSKEEAHKTQPGAHGGVVVRSRAYGASGSDMPPRGPGTERILSLEDAIQKNGSSWFQAGSSSGEKGAGKNRSYSGGRTQAGEPGFKRRALSQHDRTFIAKKKSELGLEGDLSGKRLKPVQRIALLEIIEIAKDFGVSREKSCRTLKLNSRAVYRWIAGDTKNKRHGGGGGLNKITATEEQAIVSLAKKRPDYRCRRIAYELEQKGSVYVGKSTIAEVMKKHGLHHEFQRQPKKQILPIAQELYFEPYKKNLVWGLDWTYVLVAGRFMYLLIVVDWYSRFIVSWGFFRCITKHEVVAVVTDACAQQEIDLLPPEHLRPNVVADHGSPNTAAYTSENIEYLGLDLWLCGIGRPTGNARTERTIGTLKHEEITLQKNYIDEKHGQEQIGKKITDYNFYRPNMGNGGFAPAVIHEHGRMKMHELRKHYRQIALNERLNC